MTLTVPVRLPLYFGLCLISLLSLGGGAARAASFTVGTVADAVDASPGDGICATLAVQCSLRAAVQEANALPGPDAVVVPPGEYVLVITPGFPETDATGDLDVTDDLEISGAGAPLTILDGGDTRDGVFEIQDSGAAIISDLTVQGGGHLGIFGGGIFNWGNLTVIRSVVRDNVGNT